MAMHPRISVNSICFMGTSLDQQLGYWKKLDAHRVSLLGQQIVVEGLPKTRLVLAEGACQLETIVHPFLPGQALHADKASWQEPRSNLLCQIDNAVALQAHSIYMVTGGHGGMVWEQAAEVFAEAIAPCVDYAADKGIALLIENAPAAYADIHIAHTLRDTVLLAEMADIGVCIDLAGCWAEAGLQGQIEKAVPRSRLVQVSDYVCGDRCVPARAVPGDGDMPLERLLGWLLQAGYDGAFDLELIGPRIDEEGQFSATERTVQTLTELLLALNG